MVMFRVMVIDMSYDFSQKYGIYFTTANNCRDYPQSIIEKMQNRTVVLESDIAPRHFFLRH